MLNFRIGFLSSIGGRTMSYPCLPTPFPILRKQVPGVHRKRGLDTGWQKRLARVGERLAKGWQRVGERLAKG